MYLFVYINNYHYHYQPKLKLEAKRATLAEMQGIRHGKTVKQVVEHTKFANSHALVKADLLLPLLRQFHRPRLVASMRACRWEVLFHRPDKAKKRLFRARSSRSTPAQDIENVSLVEGDFMCVEYVEEYPPIIMNVGMSSRVINYHRMSENDSKDASQSAREKKVKSVFEKMDETKQRVPRHVRLLVEGQSKKMSVRLRTARGA